VGTTVDSRAGAVEFFDERAGLIGRLGPAMEKPPGDQPVPPKPAAGDVPAK
jgi:hypothetical protein